MKSKASQTIMSEKKKTIKSETPGETRFDSIISDKRKTQKSSDTREIGGLHRNKPRRVLFENPIDPE